MGSTTPYSDLDSDGKRRQYPVFEVNNAIAGFPDKAAGFSDGITGFCSPKPTQIVGWRAIVTSAFGTTAATVQLGTKTSAGAYGSVVIPLDAVAGDVVACNNIPADNYLDPNTPLAVDQAASTGLGKYKIEMDYEFTEGE